MNKKYKNNRQGDKKRRSANSSKRPSSFFAPRTKKFIRPIKGKKRKKFFKFLYIILAIIVIITNAMVEERFGGSIVLECVKDFIILVKEFSDLTKN